MHTYTGLSKLGEPLIGGDERLYNSVHAHLDWMQRVGLTILVSYYPGMS